MRYKLIHAECVNRSFNVANYSANWFRRIYECQYWQNYEPTAEEKMLLRDRIADRIAESSKDCFHYYGKPITKQQAINLILYGEYP